MLILVVPLALVAAAMYAVSDFLEQQAAQRAMLGPELGRRGEHRVLGAARAVAIAMRRLLHDRIWFAGWTAGTLALFVQAAALHLGSVALVQTLQVATLLFALPLSTVGTPSRPGVRDWSGAALVCAGLVILLTMRPSTPSEAGAADRGDILLVLISIFIAVIVLCFLSLSHPGRLRPTLLAVAAGACFGASAALVKLTAADLTGRGIPATAADWPGYALALTTGTGLVLQQVAFGSGRLAVALTAMLITNPLVGYTLAVVGFHEALPTSAPRLGAFAVGGFIVACGVGVLAHSPVLFGADDARPTPARSTKRDSTTGDLTVAPEGG